MLNRTRFARLASSLLLAALSLQGAAASERGPVAVTQPPAATSARVIVRLRGTASTSAQILSATTASGVVAPLRNAQSLSQRIGFTLADGRSIDAHTQLVFAAGITSQALAAKLRALDDVEFAVPDLRKRAFAAPNDPLYPAGLTATTPAAGQWYLRAPTSTTPASINAEVAWAITPGLASVVIADIDTGVRSDHPDLAAKLLPGYDFISDVGTANDGDGRDSDASDPGDWITAAETAQSGGEFQGCGQSDSSWHGTQTAGLLGASTNNGLGMASIGHDVMVMPLRALGKCGGYDSDIQAAMLWAAGVAVPGVPTNAHPARVINMSLGGTGTCEASYQSVMSQVTAAGVVVVASAGNDGLAVNSPADCPGVIAVAGLRHFGSKVGYSSLGPEVALSAPAGNCVNTTGTCLYPLLTTRNTGTTVPLVNTYSDGDANPSLGTSFSAPLVAGTAALMVSLKPSLTPAQVLSALKSSTRAFPSSGSDSTVAACQAPSATAQTSECYCTTSTCGAGMLDAGAALTLVAASATSTTPTAAISYTPTTVTLGSTATFSASGSTAPSGRTIVGYAWSVTNGTGAATFTSGASTATATLAPSAVGTVTVTLTVTDSSGAIGTSTSSVSIAAAPVVTPSILAPSAINVGRNSTLTGSATVASGRTIASYAWTIANGTGQAGFSGSTAASTVTLVPAAAGTVTVTLTVTDSAGTTGSVSQTLTILTPITTTVSAVISTPPPFVVGSSATLSAAGSTTTGSATLASYAWSVVNGTGAAAISGASNASTVNIVPTAAGTIIVDLTVTDSAGSQGSTSVAITVSAASVVTVVPTITAAASTVTVGSDAVLTASATLASGRSIAGYLWTVVDGTGTATLLSPTTSSTVTLHPLTAGTVSVTLTVTDSGAVQGSTTTTYTIAAASSSSLSSGGGGALGVQWLAALLIAVLALRRSDAPRRALRSVRAADVDRRGTRRLRHPDEGQQQEEEHG